MNDLRGVTVCVEYDDLLAITLKHNISRMRECYVVTSPQDERTHALVQSIPGAKLFVTDAFYRGGAKFNKGLALEECFDHMGREGWMLIWDADIVFPPMWSMDRPLEVDVLYGARRLILNNIKAFNDKMDWRTARETKDRPGTGYFQLFNAASPTISQLPWYDATFTHAGGGDGYFTARWARKQFLPFKVLHLGPRDQNWMGRATERLDGELHPDAAKRAADMRHYLNNAPWRGKQPTEFNEHVSVDGYTPTGYKTGAGHVD